MLVFLTKPIIIEALQRRRWLEGCTVVLTLVIAAFHTITKHIPKKERGQKSSEHIFPGIIILITQLKSVELR